MCMEDIRIARKTYFIRHDVNFATLGTLFFVLPANPNRVGITAGYAANFTLAFINGVASSVLGTFHTAVVGQFGLPLRIEDFGQLITQPVSVFDINASGQNGSIFEEILLDQ